MGAVKVPSSLVGVLFAASGCLFMDPGPGAVASETAAAASSAGEPTGTSTAVGTTGSTTGSGSTGEDTPTTGPVVEPCGWTKLAPPERPPGRIEATLTLDEETGRLVLYGGRRGPVGADLRDTWEFDGITWRFIADEDEDEEDEVERPGERRGHAAAWDGEHKRLVMFGGQRGAVEGTYTERTWVREGTTWKRYDGEAPTLRAHAAMAYLPGRKRVVLFGGRTQLGLNAETWVWEGDKWHEEKIAGGPSPRDHHAMALDEGSGQLLLHGGCASVLCAEPLNDTWAFDGKKWTLLATGEPPGPRAGGAAYDRSEPAMLRFGEGVGHRWEGGAWTPAGASPQARWGFSLAYHPGLAGVVMFGGVTAGLVESDDTWLYHCTP